MLGTRFKVVAHREPWSGMISVLMGREDNHDRNMIYAAEPVQFKTEARKPGAIIEPALTLEYHEAQMLMDSLWDAGLRPTEGTGSAGAMAATQKHLEDLRTLVFKGGK